MLEFQKLSAQYQQALLRQVVPFWLKNSRDEQCGGYFDFISATGGVIEGDKFVVPQAQHAWAFAWLYNTFDGQPAWLEHARHGADFLSRFAHSASCTTYAQLDRRGRPVAASTDSIPAYSVLMAYAQLHRATADDAWAIQAKKLFSALVEQPEKRNQQAEAGGLRQLKQLSEPAARLNMLLEMQPLLDEDAWKQQTDEVLHEILTEFTDRRTDVLREYVLPGGAFLNTPEGRRINMGLTFQTANCLFDFYARINAVRTGAGGISSRKVTSQLVDWCLAICKQNWDESTGGLNRYTDFKNQPIVFPDWQQKWAWVQLEAMAALLKAYTHTHQPDCLKWFKRIHDYTFQHFPDLKHTGWHLAVDAQGQPFLLLKSLPETGCFSLIRRLTEIAQLLLQCESGHAKRQTARSGIV